MINSFIKRINHEAAWLCEQSHIEVFFGYIMMGLRRNPLEEE
jgi:hypothetical protein